MAEPITIIHGADGSITVRLDGRTHAEPSPATTAAVREMLDAGMYANFPGFIFKRRKRWHKWLAKRLSGFVWR